MTTTVTKTVGTGGDYSTVALALAAIPADLVAADQIWRIALKNQEFVVTTGLSITGHTCDATRYIELTTDTGASFVDNASKATNALRYNAANGAAIKSNTAYVLTLTGNQPYLRINKLQFQNAFNTIGPGAKATIDCGNTGTATNVDINQCIIEGNNSAGTSSGTGVGVLALMGAGNKIRNSAVIQRQSSTTVSIAVMGFSTDGAYNCTFVSTGAVAAQGIYGNYSTTNLKNCYVGNVTAVTAGSTTFAKTTSYTSQSGPPSGWNFAAFSSPTLTNVTDGTHDLRLPSTSPLRNVGTTDSTNSTPDIIGTPRPVGAAYDVGAWEEGTAPAAPTITGPGGATGSTATISVPEHSTSVATITADQGGTWSITAGADAALFAIGSGTGILTWVSAPNYATPLDVGANNVYDVTYSIDNGAGGVTSQALAVTVTNVNEAPTFSGTIPNLSGAPGAAITNLDVASFFSDIDPGGLAGGSYTKTGTAWPGSVTLTGSVRGGTLPGTAGTTTGHTITFTDSGGLSAVSNTFSITATSVPTSVTISGPSSGSVGVASTNFTVGTNVPIVSGTVVITPSDSGGGGTFTPTSVTLSVGSQTGTFTYTPGTAGSKSITVTNGASLTNPGALTYNALGVLTSDVMSNGSGSPLATTSMNWTYVPAGAIGSMTGMASAITGTTTTNSSGRLVISGLLPSGSGMLWASDAAGHAFLQYATVS